MKAAKILIVDEQGVLIHQIDLREYDLSKPMAEVDLINEIFENLGGDGDE